MIKTKPAQSILESVYGMSLNTNLPYSAQLQQIAETGHLANKTLLNEVVFRLCEIVDKQDARLTELENSLKQDKPIENNASNPVVDPTQPLDS